MAQRQHKVCVTEEADRVFREAVIAKHGTAALGRGLLQREASEALIRHARGMTPEVPDAF